MQRRAAAVYFVLFMVLAGGAYGFMQVGMSTPEVDLDGPTYSQGDNLSINGTDYTISTLEAEVEEGGHGGGTSVTRVGELTWLNTSNVMREAVDNDSTAVFRGQYRVQTSPDPNETSFTLVNTENSSERLGITEGEHFDYVAENVTTTVEDVSPSGVFLEWEPTATLVANNTTQYRGGEYRVRIDTANATNATNATDGNATNATGGNATNATAANGTVITGFTLVDEGNGSAAVGGNVSFAEGDDYEYNGTTTTVANVSNSGVRLSWVENATLANGSTLTFRSEFQTFIENKSNAANVTSVELTRVRNVSRILRANPSVENETLFRGETEYVRYTDSNRTVELDEFLPPAGTLVRSVNDTIFFESANTTTTVDSVVPAEVTFAWDEPEEETIELAEGSNISSTGYFAHFPSNDTVQILEYGEYYSQYNTTQNQITYYHERKNGVWGIVLISLMGALILVPAAYLPNK